MASLLAKTTNLVDEHLAVAALAPREKTTTHSLAKPVPHGLAPASLAMSGPYQVREVTMLELP
jgi:hypothetical protein